MPGYEPKPIALKLDAILYKDSPMPGHVKVERRIVLSMIEHLASLGFALCAVHDGEEKIKITDAMEAMEHTFNVDDSHLYFRKKGFTTHWVRLVHGNGIDVICDYSYSHGDPDGWQKAMDEFSKDTERFE